MRPGNASPPDRPRKALPAPFLVQTLALCFFALRSHSRQSRHNATTQMRLVSIRDIVEIERLIDDGFEITGLDVLVEDLRETREPFSSPIPKPAPLDRKSVV